MLAFGIRGRSRRSHLLAAALSAIVVATLIGDPPAFAKPGQPPITLLKPQQDTPIPGVRLAAKPRPADPAEAGAARTAGRPAPVWPPASTVEVQLPQARARDLGWDGPVRAGALPVWVEQAGTPALVRVRMFDRSMAKAAGVEGLLLQVDRADAAGEGAAVGISVDYTGFANAYGADWASRLRLVSLPACALYTPTVAGCATATRLASTNRAGKVTATVQLTPDRPAGMAGARSASDSAVTASAVLALTADASSSAGDYAATPLTASATWTAGGNSGDFSWSYPIRVPPSLGGPAPDIKLSYSSQSVDGRTAASNNQPSWVGEGFDWWPGYVERRYKACAEDMDGAGHNNTVKTGDECWETDNASLSLSGHSGELLKDPSDPNRWHLRNDDGSLIMHKTGAGNGANNGEYWVITTTGGTQYWFGGVAAANSTWTQPVFGNDPNEPCHQATFAASSCAQAWRWNLDRVVDPHGNTMSYSYIKETNNYGRNNTATDAVLYDRGGYLDTITYGTRTGDAGPAPMQVAFTTADRCLSTCGTHDAAHWPDTLWDQECTTSPCTHFSPTFWTTKRLASITTKVWDATRQPPGYKDVDRWTFTHTFPDPGDGTRAGLWLAKIDHTGLVGTATSLPPVAFSGVQLQNRVDTLADQLLPMNWWRISRIDNETGGATIVTYAPRECVAGSAAMPNPSALQDNTLRCYPLRWTPDWATTPITDFFHKYVVAEVRDGDLVGGAPDVVHAYEYLGGGAWHYTDDDGLVKAEDKTWSVWRGYATVRERAGSTTDTTQTYTENRYFRGMHGDHLTSGTRSVTLPAVDINGDGDTTDPADALTVNDEDTYAGMVRASIAYNGVGGPEVSSSVNEPWQSAPTASRTINGTTAYARFTNTAAATRSRVAMDTDGGTRPAGFRTTSRLTTFDMFGMPIEVDDRGDDAVTGDEKCALTDYARNTDASAGVWLAALTRQVRSFAVSCASAKGTGLGDADIIGDVRTLYDGLTFGAAPAKGDVTETQTLKAYNGGNPTYLTTARSQYDSYGRITDAWDVDNNHTITTYTPPSGGPVTRVDTTNTLGWTSTTNLEPAWGKPSSTVDFNGRRTDATFDGLGRITAVWLPGQDKAGGQGATMTYAYLVRATAGGNAVTTGTLNPSGGYATTVALYDGLLRSRQTHVPDASVAGARVVVDTFYDSAGRAWKVTDRYSMTGPPATDIYIPRPPDYSGPEALPAWTVNLFDGAGRTTDTIRYARNNIEQWRTRTAYTGDRTDTTPPSGATTTSTITDAAGQTVAARQYHGPTPADAYDTTAYSYDRKGQLTRVTDPMGNHWDTTYDLRGRKIQADDPDTGRTTITYDDAGRVVTTTNALGQTLAYTYDTLGRKTSMRDGSVTGPKRTEWTYDTVVLGQPAKSIRYDAAGTYTQEIQSYSPRYLPGIVKYTLPISETGFGATTFSYTTNYNPDGSPASTRIPATGGLGLETLTYGYNALGLPDMLRTNLGGTLVTATGYTNYGERNILTLQNNAGKIAQVGYYYEDANRRLNEIKTTSAAAPTTTYADTFYTYDPAGNVAKIADAVSGDNQCFTYDHVRRLTAAWTPASGDCATAPSVAGLGGPARYWQSWTFDLVGNRRTQVDHNTTDTTVNYAYPSAGAAQPHTLTTATYTGGASRTDSYGYDAAGHTTSRPGGANGQTLTWDAEGHLSSSTDSTGTTTYVYDADGARLIRKDPTGKTLYLPGQEIRYTNATGATSATRYYTHAGATVATRTPTGLTWLAGDHQGTTTITLDAVTQAAAVRRTTPYGGIRATTGTWPSTMDKGLVGGTIDNTGLTHLGAREYDPTTGRFISADPLFDLADPQSWQGYTYANNTPITASDPDGRRICLEECGSQEDKDNEAKLRQRRAQERAEQDAINSDPLRCRNKGFQILCKLTPEEEQLRQEVEKMLYDSQHRNCYIHECIVITGRRAPSKYEVAWCNMVGIGACLSAFLAQQQADRLADEYYPGGNPFTGHGNALEKRKWNAFHHAMWMAQLGSDGEITEHEALLLGVAHELGAVEKRLRKHEGSPNIDYGEWDSRGDMRNNREGFRIGTTLPASRDFWGFHPRDSHEIANAVHAATEAGMYCGGQGCLDLSG